MSGFVGFGAMLVIGGLFAAMAIGPLVGGVYLAARLSRRDPRKVARPGQS